MARVDALPYLTMREDRVRALWYDGSEQQKQELPKELPNWDADKAVSVSVAGEIDLTEGLGDLGLDNTQDLVAALVWSSAGTRMRGCGDKTLLRADVGGSQTFSLNCEIPGTRLAGSVDIALVVALASSPPTPSPLSPSSAGARVWSQTHKVTLGSGGGRFPMQWADFEDSLLPADAAWYLDWEPRDLHQHTGNGLCLLLNSKHSILQEALTDSDSDGQAQLLFDVLRYDVGRALLFGALRNEDIAEESEAFEEGSVGHTVCRLVATLFHDFTIESLAQRAQGDPARFDALVQDRLRLVSGST